MTGNEIFLSLGAAVVAGMVIGFEREQAHVDRKPHRQSMGGARTYPIVALVGAVAALIAGQVGIAVFIAALVGIVALIAISYFHDTQNDDRGLTSEVALLLTFLLGALAVTPVLETVRHRALLVIGLGVVGTLFLSMKAPLHGFIRKLNAEDVFATVKLLLIAVVVLPLLPDQTYGPLDVLNPRKIGLMAVLIAGISFVGYVAVRLYGARKGLVLTGLLGGLASSTAVTLSFSARAKETPAVADSCAVAVVLASSIMFVRVLVAVAVVNAALLGSLAIPMVAMGVAGLMVSFFLWRRARSAEADAPAIELKNPFELSSALKFAAMYAVVLFGAKAATTWFGAGATYLAGVLAGATDVDAITLSMANLARNGLAVPVAVTTILLAAASNTVVKAGMAVVVGGWKFAWRVTAAFGVMIAVGGAALTFLWLR